MRSSGCGLVEAGALVTSQPRPPTAGTSVTFPHCAGGAPSYLPLADGTNPYPATVIDCARPAPGRLGAARPHAHAPLGHRGSPAGRGHSREPEGRRTPRGPWIGPHLQGLRRRVQEARGDPIHGSSRLQRGRRTGRVIQCHVEARGPHRRALWSAWCFSDWGSFSSRESIGWRPCQQRNTPTSSRPKWCVR